MRIKTGDHLTLNEKVQRDFSQKGYTISDEDASIISVVAQEVFNKPVKYQYSEIKEWNLILTGIHCNNSVTIMSYCRGQYEKISELKFKVNLNKLVRTEKFYG